MKATVERRFWDKVCFVLSDYGLCWEWAAARSANGYGNFWTGERWTTAHRWSWEKTRGIVPKGLQLDHLCRNRACVNPAHLEPVTQSTNQARGGNGRKDGLCRGCGRAVDGSNLQIVVRRSGPRAGTRLARCRQCAVESVKRWKAKVGR